MKIAAIIQARMGSTRLPGKVMKKLAGKPVLHHVIERVKASQLLDIVVVATTTSRQDDIIVKEAETCEVKVFRGSEQDVLSRYYYAAAAFQADIVVRVTSDCPLFDPTVLNAMLRVFLTENKTAAPLDYMSNSLQPSFPRGLDAEIFTFKALETAFNEADKDYEREHVTPFIYINRDRFNIKNFSGQEDYSYHRWTLDTKEDFSLLKEIYEHTPHEGKYFLTTKSILETFNQHPELLQINAHVRQKQLGE